MAKDYQAAGPSRADLDAMPGPVVVDFGTSWCGHCQAARPLVDAAFADFPDVAHVRIEDGKGRPAGRSYGVKLWPTLVFLVDGHERARLVRPQRAGDVSRALAGIVGADPGDGRPR